MQKMPALRRLHIRNTMEADGRWVLAKLTQSHRPPDHRLLQPRLTSSERCASMCEIKRTPALHALRLQATNRDSHERISRAGFVEHSLSKHVPNEDVNAAAMLAAHALRLRAISNIEQARISHEG